MVGRAQTGVFPVVKELSRWDGDGEMSWLVGWLLIVGWLDSFVVFMRNIGGVLNLARYSKKRRVDALGRLLEGMRNCFGF